MQDVQHEAEKQNRDQLAGEDRTAGRASLLDPFDFTITLHFEDRQNVQMSIAPILENGAPTNGIQQGTWQVVDQADGKLMLQIVPKRDPKAEDSESQSGSRRFEIVFPPSDDDQFRLTEVGRGQGSLVFRRQKRVKESKSARVEE